MGLLIDATYSWFKLTMVSQVISHYKLLKKIGAGGMGEVYLAQDTPKDHKELKLYDTDHIPPRNELIKETLAWLDRHLGPVNR